MTQFRPFDNLNELIEHLKEHDCVYYQAPMDHKPVRVDVRQYSIVNAYHERSRVTLWTPATLTFVVNLAKHFDRFRLRVEV